MNPSSLLRARVHRGRGRHARWVAATIGVVQFVVLVIVFLSIGAAAAKEVFTFKSLNYPDHYIRHQSFLGELTPINSDLDKEDAKFIVRQSLNEAFSTIEHVVSFESVNHRGYFLRHKGFRMRLEKYDGTEQFQLDASFAGKRGLAADRGVSFESVNFPDHFIRHHNKHLWVNRDDGTTPAFWRDATFFKEGAPLAGCRLWGISGPREIWQQNGRTVTLELEQAGAKITGKVSYCVDCPPNLSGQGKAIKILGTTIGGYARGHTARDKFKIDIEWTPALGAQPVAGGNVPPKEIEGNVDAEGKLSGTTFNSDSSESQSTFQSDRPARCLDAGEMIAVARPVPEARSAIEVNGSRVSDIVSQPVAACVKGHVWRVIRPDDLVCVTPRARVLAAQENDEAADHVDPNGAYGPNTCLSGYVWRNAFSGDAVCVTPSARDRVASENRRGPDWIAGD